MQSNTKMSKLSTANQIAIAALDAQGMRATEISKELGLSSGYISGIKKKARKYDLTSNPIVKGAYNTIKRLSQGEPVGQIETVKDSTALAAASMIYDHYQPRVTMIQQDVRTQSIQVTPETIQAMSDYLKLKASIDNDKQPILIDNSDNVNDISELGDSNTPQLLSIVGELGKAEGEGG